ncbi:Fic family protein [Nibribacter koreensis]|uniref:Fic family protein n=1 Tax=Nibribacter koreensis TaxID=1084519 RepID=A0ABP8F5B1_9BACT
MASTSFSQEILNFHGRTAPKAGILVGYGAIIEHYGLQLPLPRQLAIISQKNRKYGQGQWQVFPPSYQPADSLAGHLTFALKYEGINLLFFKKLFQQLTQGEVLALVQKEYTSQYMRKVWFLYEWLMQQQLPVPDLRIKNYVPLIDEKLQYALTQGDRSARHRILNNLPGTVSFCPLVSKTTRLQDYLTKKLDEQISLSLKGVHKDILQRTSAFLLLKDSKASFSIEGERPTQTRAIRWGNAIGQAGTKPLSKQELLRLQQLVIGESRFTALGYRTAGGFVGEHDRHTGEPLPDHVSARWQDIEPLMEGLLESIKLLEARQYHPVLAAAQLAFGLVFIHPFVDGNGRLHRYLIHHLLASLKFTPQGIIFPVSAAILDHLTDYRQVLETYSHPLLDFIEWRTTPDHNIEVLNQTIDYYRYFDATPQAEFLFQCVDYTIQHIIPEEVSYLQKYDRLKDWLDNIFSMPDKTVALLIQFLHQGNGSLSTRAKTREFAALTPEEMHQIEVRYKEVFEAD